MTRHNLLLLRKTADLLDIPFRSLQRIVISKKAMRFRDACKWIEQHNYTIEHYVKINKDYHFPQTHLIIDADKEYFSPQEGIIFIYQIYS